MDSIPLRLWLAFDRKEKGKNAFRHRRSHFALSVGLAPAAKGEKLAGISTIFLRKRGKAYPPRAHDIYESPATRKIWEDYQARTPYPDTRRGMTWKPFHELDPSHLQHVVKEDHSAIIRDVKSHEIIGIVVRNFSNNNRKLLDWINEIIEENTGSRRSVRLEDPGKLCQIGYTSGAHNNPQLGWARNLLRKKDDATVTRLMYECSLVFALFWNLIQNHLPKEVNSDFEKWLSDSKMVRMDTKGRKGTVQGEYTVKYGADQYTFHGVNMPPPSGLIATNYSRFIHKEGCSHKYAVSWTTRRDLERDQGGHFFICSHAVKVEAAADTVIVWNPSSLHGTSLQHYDPEELDIFQAGLAIVTPPGVDRLWKDFCEEKITLEEARGKMLELESEEVEDD